MNKKGTGYKEVDSSVVCVLTRFRLRSVRSVFKFFQFYRLVKSQTKRVPGLITSTFLVEDMHTCYTLSLWRDADSILQFNSLVHGHIEAANSCFKHLQISNGRPQLWSAQFDLSAVSPFNLYWEGVEASELGVPPVATEATTFEDTALAPSENAL